MTRAGVTARCAAAAALGLLAAAGCGGGSVRSDRAARPLSLEQKLNLGVVAIDARIGRDDVRSSGVVLDADRGLVLTSAHTVWGATSLKVATGLGVLHGRIVARAPCNDLALLETQPRIPGLVRLAAPASGGAAETGELLNAVGRRRADPDIGAYSLLSIPARLQAPAGPLQVDPRLPRLPSAIRLDSQLVPDLSGGPIVDRQGRLLGMATVAGASPGAAIPWSAISARLAELRPGPRRIYVGWRDQYRCVGALHRFERALHPGFRFRDARLNAPVSATRLPGTENLDQG